MKPGHHSRPSSTRVDIPLVSNSTSGVEDNQRFSATRPPSRLFRRLRLLIFVSFVLGCAYWLLVPLQIRPRQAKNASDASEILSPPDHPPSPKSKPGDRVYALSREAFNRLPKSEEAEGEVDNGIQDSATSHVDDVVPAVTQVPNYPKKQPVAPPRPSPRPGASIDAELCPESPSGCSFLLPGLIAEQESKAQIHLYQLGLLAMALNRTLVRPNVGSSRMGTCFGRPFDFYYASDALERHGIPSIAYDDFLAWTNTRMPRPHAQIVRMARTNAHYPSGAVEVKGAADASTVSQEGDGLCLGQPISELVFGNWSHVTVYPPRDWSHTHGGRRAFGQSLIQTFSSGDVDRRSFRAEQSPQDRDDGASDFPKPDVLVFDFGLVHTFLDSGHLPGGHRTVLPFAHFAYSPALVALASHVAHTLSPFVAVHWRQETMPTQSIPGCTQGLIDKLDQLAKDWPELRTVYLATDYPLEAIDPQSRPSNLTAGSPPAHSGTFAHQLTETHHSSMRTLLSTFDGSQRDAEGGEGGQQQGRLSGELKLATYSRLVRSGELARSLPRALRQAFPEDAGGVDLAAIDAGLVGILDKMVAIEADVLLVGEAEGDKACGKKSSFTRQIVQEREKNGRGGGRSRKGKDAHASSSSPGPKIIVGEWRQP
jgi:hypothetical protein